MTQSRDHKEASGGNSLSFWEIFHKHSDRAVKVCICLLAAMCVGALIAITIYLANPPMTQVSVNNTAVALDLAPKLLPLTTNTCEVTNCTVECRNTTGIYLQVFNALQGASCGKDITLIIYGQRFPDFIVENRWFPANKTINEVSIVYSNFSQIFNEAFNCIDFTETQILSIVGINVFTLGNGVLLGLSNLRSLRIVGSVGQIERCFFQPVQSSLIRLRLGTESMISGDSNVFGISTMQKLKAFDFSDNTILGPLGRNFFTSVPHIQLLTLSNSKITSIDEDAFDDIADRLELLDLSNNLLTSVDVKSMERILSLGMVNLYLLGNDWYCNCDLQSLIHLHKKYYARFGDIPYCKGPLGLYGVLFTNVSSIENCDFKGDEDWMLATTETASSPPIVTSTSTVLVPTTELQTTETVNILPSPFQMRCESVLNIPSDEDSSSSSDQMEYFLFAPPCHEFEPILLKNNSVQVVVEGADTPINIVWFSDAVESFVYTIDGITVDYNCEGYTDPYLIVDNLLQNSTYTFCLIPVGTYSITPFNCLPLHVPILVDDEDGIWISTDNKQFTVGIVCLIFACSMLLGGVIAFFGIKAYPDLLEGSRHVLVVKKSDQTCYVSTITEGEYMFNQTMQKSSLKKKGSLNKIPLPSYQSTSQFKIVSSLPPPITPPLPPLPVPKKSEQTTNESLDEAEDHYELPCIYDKGHECQLQCIPNKYAMSPMSPPPLPKRNSDIALYGSSSELLREKPHPKLSF